MYILDADRRQLCIFGRVALDSLCLDCLFKRTVQHGQYIFYGFWRFSVINQLAYHLLHLFGGQIAQSDRAQMGLEVIFNDTAIGRDGVGLLRWLNKLGEPGIQILRYRALIIGNIGVCIQLAQLFGQLALDFLLRCAVDT